MLPFFIVEFRWPASFSLFLCLSPALYYKFVDMTVHNLENTDTETISAFRSWYKTIHNK